MKFRLPLVLAALVIAVFAVLSRTRRPGPPAVATTAALQPQNRVTELALQAEAEAPPAVTNHTHPKPPFLAVRKADLAPQEITQIQWLLRERFKPAIAKWAQAYAGRSPFNPEEVTFDQFHSRLGDNPGRYAFTFMVDGSTLSILEMEGHYAVGYVSAPDAARLSEVHGGQSPIATLPVTKDQVIAMVKADIGAEFPMEEITISPTGLASDVNGGAFVRVKPIGKNNEVGVVNLVIGPDGKLLSYASDPFYSLLGNGLPKSGKAFNGKNFGLK